MNNSQLDLKYVDKANGVHFDFDYDYSVNENSSSQKRQVYWCFVKT